MSYKYGRYKRDIVTLTKFLKSKGTTVDLVSSVKRMHDYAGMNPDAAKSMGFKQIGKHELLDDKTMKVKTQLRNLKHEVVEKSLMDKGMKYYPAHRIALKDEIKPISFIEKLVNKDKKF